MIRIEFLLHLVLVAASMGKFLELLRPMLPIGYIDHHSSDESCRVLQLASFFQAALFIIYSKLVVMKYLFGVSSQIQNAFNRFSAIVSACFSYAFAIVFIVRRISPGYWAETIFLGILAQFSSAFRAVRLL
jgi:ABC-type long-subunit fatty acid transport system fused permease/ATPase subunit